ncbi:MAG: hypothetical protein AAGK04_11045 [Planctomycetota bacterium]
MFPLAAALLGLGGGRLTGAERRPLRWRVLPPLGVWMVICSLPVIGFVWFAWEWRSDALRLMGLLVHAPIILTLLGALISLLRTGRAVLARHRERVESMLLELSRCASCAYPIAELEPDASGAVHCPECDACWRSDRLGRNAAEPSEPVVVSGFTDET